ncbi:TPA: bacteriocin immunity protein [Streptococcus pyogenes]|uniref:bacteriocin immunity protein n=1 Tax=Streptococcus pyogenes TaxID=1314 RepID=UPI000640A056|nr:bacteriocin immunity protein [Streptococcus pyogenes]HER4535935.1 bacteriocin immunity protein [Streptococcus pyogenes NGAS757]HER4587319.1 bacteriocin immunity protein [Streptococcus pyogenes NGAS615]HER4595811.1 bacteriocin immunity protein [Streptococcus pyogenes NGAS613]HER4602668.1 bacteriocin immunity protein [Streptococcus pyogenes NGAS608]HER4605819.1 bacteriocin immunity protein [Streptococcus pyogenes NGAS609]HER4609238.1 bacteriocin immunity protein [Streptococcus pyogenes NGAS6
MPSEKEILDALSKVYSEPVIQTDDYFRQAIFELASQLEKERMSSLLATKIDSLINQYILTHQFDAPKSIFDLSRLVKTKACHYKGTAISAIMLGSFLSGGPK